MNGMAADQVVKTTGGSRKWGDLQGSGCRVEGPQPRGFPLDLQKCVFQSPSRPKGRGSSVFWIRVRSSQNSVTSRISFSQRGRELNIDSEEDFLGQYSANSAVT